jgi:hypothetical protein
MILALSFVVVFFAGHQKQEFAGRLTGNTVQLAINDGGIGGSVPSPLVG